MKNTMSLNGNWQFRSADDESWLVGRVPGSVQLDLMENKLLPDPYIGTNEAFFHHLEGKQWIYQKTFHVDNVKDYDKVFLHFDGIDTVADVYLNEIKIGSAKNMFIPYSFDVGNFLQKGENTVKVHFTSSIEYARAQHKADKGSYVATGEKSRVFIRKLQYTYGWDCGPRIEQVGLFRDVYLAFHQKARLQYPFFDTTELTDHSATIQCGVEIERFSEDFDVRMRISYEGEEIENKTLAPLQDDKRTFVAWQGKISNPHLWYPNGLGAHPLYDISFTVENGGVVYDELHFMAGLRTVKLLREKDEIGESFVFEVNGIKIFAKGANWVPGDNLLSRFQKDHYEQFVKLARDSNMNMLRTWGGGIYETKDFYDACNRYGILVWQEFLYACAQYPDHLEDFQKMGEMEAIIAVKSLRAHPSLALWCGNNENNWCFHIWKNCDDIPEYSGNQLYKQIFPRVCKEHDPGREYWISSPFGNEKDPNGMQEGDRHSWEVWHQKKHYQYILDFDTSRFVSEFGFLSMPCYKTVLSYTNEENRHLTSPAMLSHAKEPTGMEKLWGYVMSEVGFPSNLQSFIYLSQFVQANSLRIAIEHWRSRKFLSAGALIWQYNDSWPGLSWSVVDYYARKKAAYYAVQKSYSPILPILKYEKEQINLYIANYLCSSMSLSVCVRSYSLNGTKRKDIFFEVECAANASDLVKSFSLEDLGIGYVAQTVVVDENFVTIPKTHNGDLLDSCIFATIAYKGGTNTNNLIFHFPLHMPLQKPVIKTQQSDLQLTLTSDVPAFGVFLESEYDVDVSDNGFSLEPNVPYTIFFSENPGSVEVYDLTTMTKPFR